MPFSEAWSGEVYERIRAAVEGAGYKCLRGDEVHGRVVLQDIWAKLHESAIVVADLTGENPNVFYELGIAHTIGRDVVPIVQAGQSLPFDQTPFRTIFYQLGDEGLEALEQSLASFLATPAIMNSPIVLLKASQIDTFNAWRRNGDRVLQIRGEQFRGAVLDGANLSRCRLSECDFHGVSMKGADMSSALFIRADLSEADLRGATLARANLSECSLVSANLEGVDLAGTLLLRADISGANFSGANLAGATIDHATWKRFKQRFRGAKNVNRMVVER